MADLRAARPLPQASWQALPRWRGFNLPHMYSPGWEDARRGFREEEIKWIADWGFDFVRLPLDYHFFIVGGDWAKLDEKAMLKVKQVVEWGAKYGVHVSVNLHRAPGYCINPPAEPKSVWTDEEALRVCELHWRAWARLLKRYGNEQLSFNLFNEPRGVDGAGYARVASRLIQAIHEESPGRLVILDGIDTGTATSPELAALPAAQALRGYNPMDVSHYKAEWSGTWEGVEPPAWPPAGYNGFLYGAMKKEIQKPLVLEGGFQKGGRLAVHVEQVSQDGELKAYADEEEVWSHAFKQGPGKGEWKESRFSEEYKIYQNLYDKAFEFKVPACKRLELRLEKGDWLTLKSVTASIGAVTTRIPASGRQWGAEPGIVSLDAAGKVSSSPSARQDAVRRLLAPVLKPWVALKDSGVGVMVGEFGAYNKTPHSVMLAWLEDQLGLYKANGIGWALWNFSGAFGVLDSDRADVAYEDWHGRKLDKKLLALLQAH